MLRSYVAVASPLGLLTLLPESEAAVRHLTDRAYHRRRPERGLCLWVVMAAEDAARVAAEMEAGELRSALVSLDREARQLGSILPH
jgi:hypothetical protein